MEEKGLKKNAWILSTTATKRLLVGFIVYTLFSSVYLLFHLNVDVFGSIERCLEYTRFKMIGPLRTLDDNFDDLRYYISIPRSKDEPHKIEEIIIKTSPITENPTIAEKMNMTILNNMTNQDKFQLSMTKYYVYKDPDPVVEDLLNDLATLPIIAATLKSGGTQMKLKLDFPNNITTLFKPMRFPREHLAELDGNYLTDYERHHSEIAAYHLDRVLGFRRTVPVVGRRVNLTRLYELADNITQATFYRSPSGNTCFVGHCHYYCDLFNPVCGDPHMIEGSLAAYLPQYNETKLYDYLSPWRRSYNFWVRKSYSDVFCDNYIRSQMFYQDNDRRLLDMTELSIFDFLMGNGDRHSYSLMHHLFGTNGANMIFDNGRGFGNPHLDDLTILGPLLNCCLIRDKTIEKFLELHNGPMKLSDLLRESLSKDPLTPVLWEPYYTAMDRRLKIVLQEIRKCITVRLKKPRFIENNRQRLRHRLYVEIVDVPFSFGRNLTIPEKNITYPTSEAIFSN